MGGSYGGGLLGSDIRDLEKKIKERLKDAQKDTNRHIFISFDHDDLDEVNLLRGQAKNQATDLQFDDYSVKEPFDSSNSDYIKRNIREKIDHCSVTLVYLTEKTASSKWVNWEIEESIKKGKSVVGVYKGDSVPAKLPTAFKNKGCTSVKWEHSAIMKAIEDANKK